MYCPNLLDRSYATLLHVSELSAQTLSAEREMSTVTTEEL